MADPQIKLPTGYTLDQPQAQAPPQGFKLPSGYTLDQSTSQDTSEMAQPGEPEDIYNPEMLIPMGSPHEATTSVPVGFAKSAAETVARPTTWLGEKAGMITPEQRQSVLQPLERTNLGEQLGAGIEQVAEFMAAEGLLKKGIGLVAGKAATMSDKYAALQAAHKILETYPKTAAILGSALTSGTVGTGQAMAHGEDFADAVNTGLLTGAAGGVGEGVSQLLKGAAKTASAADTTFEVAGQEGRVGSRAIAGQEPNEKLAEGLRSMANGDAANVPSIRDVYREAAQTNINKAKALYSEIDQSVLRAAGPVTETGGQAAGQSAGLKQLSDQLDKIELNSRTAWSDEAIQALDVQRSAVENKIAELKAAYPDLATKLDAADSLWKKGMAQRDVNKAIEMSTSGVRPGTWAAADASSPAAPEISEADKAIAKSMSPESVDAANLERRLQKLYSSNRLQEAVGEDRADNMIALVELMKSKTELTRGLERAFGATLMHHPVTSTGHLIYSTVKDVWTATLNSPTATKVALAGFRTGASAAKIAPAVVNALQIEQSK